MRTERPQLNIKNTKKTLADRFPEVAFDWFQERNGSLTPQEVSPFSGLKVWWRCRANHEWNATISNRTSRGAGCPYCSGLRATPERNLVTFNPNAAAQWNHEKNGDLTPDQIAPFSGRRVHWKCMRGHEWQSTVATRTSGRGCPFCWRHSSRAELRILAELELLFHRVTRRRKIAGLEVDIYIHDCDVAIEYDGSYWHKGKEKRDSKKNFLLEELNIHLIRFRERPLKKISSFDIQCNDRGITKKDMDNFLILLKFFCDDDAINRINKYLALGSFHSEERYRDYISVIPTLSLENNLEIVCPDLCREWDFEKNFPLTPAEFTRGSQHKIWWKCGNQHSWLTTILTRTINGSGCPFCSGNFPTTENNLATLFPEIASQWNAIRNGDLIPTACTSKSSKTVWWICENGHEWRASIANRTSHKSGCPVCSGHTPSATNNLAAVSVVLSRQWHPVKNGSLTAGDVTPSSGKKVWWLCEKGHEWIATIHSRSKGSNCPYCGNKRASASNNFAVNHPLVLEEWDAERNRPLLPTDLTRGSKRVVWWSCKYGHSWQSSINSRTRPRGSGCPECSRSRVG